MPDIPRDISPDSTLALVLDPYRFVQKRCRHYGSDVFQTRLLLKKTICMTGPEAAKLFCQNELFTRVGATPNRIQKTLFGKGGVQGLDGEAHLHRKEMFMSLMSPEHIQYLGRLTEKWWLSYIGKWTSGGRVVLYDEVCEILARAVCDWAGISLHEADVKNRTAQLTALFEYAGAVGPKHWWSRIARKQSESWAEEIIEQIRAGRRDSPAPSAASVIATYRDLNGELLDPNVAAVELLNVLRPTVAISVFIIFAAHALHCNPECRHKLADDGYVELFVQEVRRFYPFFPSVTALARREFEWNAYRFPQGSRVLLDLYGTNHDPRAWDAPGVFRAERFRNWDGSLFNFIPQGPGDLHLNHRCPGEQVTIELMKVACNFLARRTTYDVPCQDLRLDFSKLPALPKSRFVITNVAPAFESLAGG